MKNKTKLTNKTKTTTTNNTTKTNNTTTSKTKKNNHISVFSYNISWESMTGKKKNWMLCSVNDNNKDHPKHYSVCVGNISGVIEENDTDFVCLQEAMDYEKLIKESPRLTKMKHLHHKSGLDNMVTFWKPKYKLLYSIKGEFEEGRPWLATIFHNGLCLINVHFGHYDDAGEMQMLELMVQTVKKGINIEEQKQGNGNGKGNGKENEKENRNGNKKVNRYIISGDFNYDIKKFGDNDSKFILDGVSFYHNPKKLITCRLNRWRHYDHVIDSKSVPIDIVIPDVHHMASDHKPIIAKLLN